MQLPIYEPSGAPGGGVTFLGAVDLVRNISIFKHLYIYIYIYICNCIYNCMYIIYIYLRAEQSTGRRGDLLGRSGLGE